MSSYDVVVIGAGTSGLVAAASLAKAGKKVLVLEGKDAVGGRAVTREFHPGYKVSPVFHGTGGVLPSVVRNLELESHGLELVPEDRGVTTLCEDGQHFYLPAERGAARAAAARLSERDGRGYERLTSLLDRLVGFLRPLLTLQPLPFKRPTLGGLLEPAWQALRFRRLGEKDMLELLRIAPQCLEDFVDDWFHTDVIKATVAFPALLGTQIGPRSPGTVTNLLLWEASSMGGPLRRGGLPRGGLGSISAALRRGAERYGAQIRTNARVVEVLQEDDGRATGVRLAEGDETITARAILSNAGPRKTLLELADPTWLGPRLRGRLQNYRSRGCTVKVHFAVDALPEVKGGKVEMGGRLQIGERTDDFERAFDDAKYGRASAQPCLEIAVPSVLDPSLAPSGKHVVSVLAQFGPYALRDSDWKQERGAFADRVQSRIESFAPGFTQSIVAREVLTPVDFEEQFGLEGGHILGGDLTLDQLFTNRPVPELATYQTPLAGLYVTGAATHPGGFLTGAAGANAAKRVLRDWKALNAPRPRPAEPK